MVYRTEHTINLISQIKNSNQFAFRRLFDQYKNKVYSFALKFVLDKMRAEEITQIVFIKVWDNRSSINPEACIDTYLYVITKNACFDHLRKLKNDQKLREGFLRNYRAEIENGADSLIYSELVSNTEQIIAQLPPKQQKVYVMAKLDQKSYDEIAKSMNISKNTVKTQLKLANDYVKKWLIKEYGSAL